MNDGAGVVFVAVLWAILVVLYFVPAIVASCRKHRDVGSIFVLCLFLGWTFIGWLIALIWASSGNIKPASELESSAMQRMDGRKIALLFVLVIGLGAASIFALADHASPVTRTQTSSDVTPSPTANLAETAFDEADKVPIRIDASRLLAAFDADENAAGARYIGRKVIVTGTITGIFIPTLEQRLKAAKTMGGGDFPLITMGGPEIYDAAEGMLSPGIRAYSVDGPFFGEDRSAILSNPLYAGKLVTLDCTVNAHYRASSFTGVHESGQPDAQLDLRDCTLEPEPRDAYPSVAKPSPMTRDSPDSSAPAIDNESSTPAAPEFLHVGGSVTPPEVIHQVDPQFSEEARAAKHGGVVRVYLIVDQNGLPTHVQAVRSAGMGLDEEAVKAVQQYRFKPAMQNGNPVAVDLYIDINFNPNQPAS